MKFSKFIGRPTYIALLYVGLFIFLSTTNPANLPIVLLMLPLLLLFLGLYLSILLALERVLQKTAPRRRKLYAAYASGVPTFLLVLSSVDQLTWRDVTLVIFLVLCLLFYTSRAHFGKGQLS